jgi:hypothetical protein
MSLRTAVACLGCDGKGLGIAQTPVQTLQPLQASGQLPTLDVTSSLAGTDADGNGVRAYFDEANGLDR